MLNWLKKFFGDNEKKVWKRYRSFVEQVNALEPHYQQLSDAELREQTDLFRSRLSEGETLDDLLPEAFATVREASVRTIGMRHYDVQLIGGVVLHQGRIAEMKTGEGKTLVATLPLYLNALTGEGAHLITVNDYLARRDAGWMGPVYHLLGLRVGFIGHDYSALFDPDYVDPTGSLDDERLVHWRPSTRREAYEADITYGTNNEFGFDYLRDNMVPDYGRLVQRGHNYAIVDEVDNILIDEARTPLIISGPASKSSSDYARFAQIVRNLRAGRVSPDEVKKGAQPDGDVLLDLKSRSVVITEEGLSKVEGQIEELGAGESVYDPQHSALTHYLENALKAKFIYHRDKDYVVQEGEVIIVDEFTGRLMPGRRWSDGLHQAVEAKEGVDVRRESVTYATITFQNYFRMYGKLSGMTGTAETEAEEFGKIYNLEVTVVPTNKPRIRRDHTDQIYRSEDAKFNAVIREIEERATQGQPILVGTTAVETSERLSRKIHQQLGNLIRQNQIVFHVLNAKQNADEAAVVAQAGQPGTVTIATNMAGRGTDILLGGNPESLASRYLKEQGVDRKQVEELAQSLFGAQKTQKISPQVLVERSNGKLGDDFIAELQALHDWYEQASDHMERKGTHLFLVETMFGDVEHMVYEQKRELVRSILQNNLVRARRILHEFEGLGEEKIAEVQNMNADCTSYQTNRRDRPRFLANKLFERIYTARARLVQLTLRGDLQAAEELVRTTPGLKPEYIEEIQRIQQQCRDDHERVKAAGGLHVLGTERHEARRIDNQLRGRSGRQGDPGSSRFYLSLEDELMKRFGRMDAIKKVMERLSLEDDVPIEAGVISKSIESAQTRVEGYNFDIRKHTVDYDNVMNKQREVIYTRRRRILEEAHEQHRIDTLIERYFLPHQLVQEIHEEVQLGMALPEPVAHQRVRRLLPDVSFDLATLRAANNGDLAALLEPLIKEQQHKAIPTLVDELSDILDLPDDAELFLQEASYEEASDYLKELWVEQREGDLEDRIKDLFEKEFSELVERYLTQYESWLRGQISEAIGEATNPATDEVNVSLVQRRLQVVLPEIEQQDLAELSELSPERLQRTLESLIPVSVENGQPVSLLTRELLSLVPLLPVPHDLIWQNLSLSERERERERYIGHYAESLERLAGPLPQEEREAIAQDALEYIHEELRPLVSSATRPPRSELTRTYNAIAGHNGEVVARVLDLLDTNTILDVLMDVVDYAFEQWRMAIGNKQLNHYQRTLMLRTIDHEWQEYLTAMEDLRQGIGLQAIGQRDPLVQYQTQGYRMFNELLANIDHTIVHRFFLQLPEYHRYLEETRAEVVRREKAAREGYEIVTTGKSSRKKSSQPTIRREMPKVGPNDLCPCGSGKKYKHCHGRSAPAPGRQVQRGHGSEEKQQEEEEQLVAVGGGNDDGNNGESGPEQPRKATQPRGRAAPSPPARKKKRTKR
jgi:preprotein translocase SecA subunit